MNAGELELEEGLSSQVEEHGSTGACVALIACEVMLLLMIAA